MANPFKGEVSFDALGKTFTMRLGVNARALVEERMGIAWTALMARPAAKWRERDAIVIMWAGLFQHHKMTEEEVGDLIDQVGSETISALILKAFGAAAPKGDANGTPRPPQRRRRTGTGKS